jgi:nucleotide-binding universal stress UspA family protein
MALACLQEKEEQMPESILVAVDGSDNAAEALRFAAEISDKMGGRLTILHVLMHGKPADELERMAEVEHVVKHAAPLVMPDSLNFPASMAELLSHPEGERARAVTEIGAYLLRTAKQTAGELGARDVATLQRDGDYAEAILEAAKDVAADLIVLGRRGLGGLRSIVLGSVSTAVLHRAECSVLAVHPAKS